MTLSSHSYLTIIAVGILGAIIGSFLNVVIYRLPRILKQQWRQQCLAFLEHAPEKADTFNLWVPRSHCPHCQATIPFWQNIPLISYFLLRGKCRACGVSIAWRYPVVEFSSTLLAMLVSWRFGTSWQMVAALVLTWGLIALVFIDLEHHLLPDEITLSLLWLGLLLSIRPVFATSIDAILGAVMGYASLWLVGWLFKRVRGIEGIGYGDYKLFALFGAWLGWQALPIIIFVAALLGTLVGVILLLRQKILRTTPIAFGPFLAFAGWLAVFFGARWDFFSRWFF